MRISPSFFLFLLTSLLGAFFVSGAGCEGKGSEGSCLSGEMNGIKRMSTSILSSAIVRGPSPGEGRNTWVKYNGLVWTVGMPGAKKTANMDIKAQTELALSQIDERLAQAGIKMTLILTGSELT